jgi:hypothetical protein
MIKKGKTEVQVDFTRMDGGLNTTDPAVSLKRNQIQYAMNVKPRKNGFSLLPGYLGLATSAIFEAPVKGMHIYQRDDGTEILLAMSGGKLYYVNPSDGSKTELYDLTGTGDAWFANTTDKCFVCNGTKLVKVESASLAYQVGITAPAAGNAAAAAGGTLPDGAYGVYIGYARKVGSLYLFSQGYSLGNVTLGTGSNTVAITNFAQSADAQVTHKIVWMTDAAGAIYYYYAEADNDATTTVNVANNSTRNTSYKYAVDAELNYVPGAAQYVFAFNNIVFYSIDKSLYWSLRAANDFDLDRFNTQANGRIATYEFKIKGIFSIGQDMFLNTEGGVIRVPYGDPNNQYGYARDRGVFFLYPQTIRNIEGGVVGLTNRGFKIFNGESFTELNLGKDIQPEIDRIISGADSDFVPNACIHRRNDRVEYQVLYRDLTVGTACHNRCLMLNISTLVLQDNDRYTCQWYMSDVSGSHQVETKNGTMYRAQSIATGGTIYKEVTTTTQKNYVYNNSGALLTTATSKTWKVITREELPDPEARCRWFNILLLMLNRRAVTVKTRIADRAEDTDSVSAGTQNVSTWGNALWESSVWSIDKPIIRKLKLAAGKLKGRSVYLEIEQTADDTQFDLQMIRLIGIAEKGNFI